MSETKSWAQFFWRIFFWKKSSTNFWGKTPQQSPQSLIILQVQVAASKLSWDEELVTLFIVLFQMFLHVEFFKRKLPFFWTGHLFQQSSAILRKRQTAIFGAVFPHVLDVFEAQIDHVIYAIPQNTQVSQVLQSGRCKTICTVVWSNRVGPEWA